MFEFYATFDYNSITDPTSGSEYEYERDGYAQWEVELHDAIRAWGSDLLAYRVLDRNVLNRRVIVRFVVASPLPAAEQVEAIQTLLFDEGGLSGRFSLGRERLFRVTYTTARDVWALDAAQAGSRVPGDVIRVEHPEDARTREPVEDDTTEFRDIAKED